MTTNRSRLVLRSNSKPRHTLCQLLFVNCQPLFTPWKKLKAFHALIIVLLQLSCTQGDPKFQQYFVEGEQLYQQHCSNCHQRNGKGLAMVYPPLATSDFMEKNFEEVACTIKYGMTGEVTVNGNVFNQRMPGVPSLSELEIAEILTYVYNSWGRERGLVDVKSIGPILQHCVTAEIK